MKIVKIIDYSVGNIFSTIKAFERFDCHVELANRPEQLKSADYLVLPGVGSFGDAIANLMKQNLIEAIQIYAKSGKPLLGICLGMQLLFTTSEEFGFHHGLNIIPGAVNQLLPQPNIKLPNIGWGRLELLKMETFSVKQTSVYKGIPLEKDVYFVHTFVANPTNSNHWLSKTLYGAYWFCSSALKDNVLGFQFHPEKSGKMGLQIIKNFLRY